MTARLGTLRQGSWVTFFNLSIRSSTHFCLSPGLGSGLVSPEHRGRGCSTTRIRTYEEQATQNGHGDGVHQPAVLFLFCFRWDRIQPRIYLPIISLLLLGSFRFSYFVETFPSFPSRLWGSGQTLLSVALVFACFFPASVSKGLACSSSTHKSCCFVTKCK
jgi:hypothetical protein